MRLFHPITTFYFHYFFLRTALLIWASTYVTSLQRIYLLQKRTVRLISKADYRAPNKPLFMKMKILDIFSIYSLQVSSFMYLYHHNLLPLTFCQIFQTGSQIHHYSTRNSESYRSHLCRTNIYIKKKFPYFSKDRKYGTPHQPLSKHGYKLSFFQTSYENISKRQAK